MTTDSKAVCGGGEDPFSVERIARLICEASGQNPDQCVHGSGVVTYGGDGKQAYAESKCYRRAWENHISPANAVIARYAALASTAGAGAGDWEPWIAERIACSEGYLKLAHQNGTDNPYARGRLSALEEMRHRLSAVPASPRSGAGEGEVLRELSDLAYPGPWTDTDDGIHGSPEHIGEPWNGGDIICDMPSEGDDSRRHWPANRIFIRRLVNAYRSGELVHRSEPAGRSEKGAGEDEGRRAIRFAMGLEDHWDRFEFLNAFIGGDLSEWPEFTKPEPAPAQSPSTSDAEG